MIPKILSVVCTVGSMICCIFGENLPSNVRDVLLCWLSIVCCYLAFAAA